MDFWGNKACGSVWEKSKTCAHDSGRLYQKGAFKELQSKRNNEKAGAIGKNIGNATQE